MGGSIVASLEYAETALWVSNGVGSIIVSCGIGRSLDVVAMSCGKLKCVCNFFSDVCGSFRVIRFEAI